MNCVEIAMRNSVHRAFSAEYGPLWFDIPGLLEPNEIALVDAAKVALVKKRKPLTPEGIVAELSFGFWTTLMSAKHHSHTPSVEEYLKPWPRLLKATFPHVPKRERTRTNISAPLNRIRKLRNRVSHHEPIWHQDDLLSTYLEARKLCEWLSPGMADAIATIDRFREVYDMGSVAYQDAVKQLAGWKPPTI